jgi:hypothetical protein
MVMFMQELTPLCSPISQHNPWSPLDDFFKCAVSKAKAKARARMAAVSTASPSDAKLFDEKKLQALCDGISMNQTMLSENSFRFADDEHDESTGEGAQSLGSSIVEIFHSLQGVITSGQTSKMTSEQASSEIEAIEKKYKNLSGKGAVADIRTPDDKNIRSQWQSPFYSQMTFGYQPIKQLEDRTRPGSNREGKHVRLNFESDLKNNGDVNVDKPKSGPTNSVSVWPKRFVVGLLVFSLVSVLAPLCSVALASRLHWALPWLSASWFVVLSFSLSFLACVTGCLLMHRVDNIEDALPASDFYDEESRVVNANQEERRASSTTLSCYVRR